MTAEQYISKLTKVIYHGRCPDGILSQLLIKRYIREQKLECTPEYYGVSRGRPPPAFKRTDVVLMLDFVYTPAEMYMVHNRVSALMVIDHHPGAKALDYAVYDADHCAAVICWNWLYPGVEPPRLLQLVEDVDLYKMKHKDSAALHAMTSKMQESDFEQLFDTDKLNATIAEGRPLLQVKTQQINDALTHVSFKYWNGLLYGVVNSTVWTSDIGNAIMNMPESPDFAMVYTVNAGSTIVSLRSKKVNVSKIAGLFKGGGGLPEASAFKYDGLICELPEA